MKKLLLIALIFAGISASAQDGFFYNGKKLYPEKFAQTKTAGAFAVGLTYGLAKAKTKSYLSKPKARTRAEKEPSFKLVISPVFNTGVQTAGIWSAVQSPDEFALVKFRGDYKHMKFERVVTKKNGKIKKERYTKAILQKRWLETGSFGLYSGMTTSPDPKQFITFDWEEGEGEGEFIIKTYIGIPGEYGFIYIGNNTAYANQAVYAFGIE